MYKRLVLILLPLIILCCNVYAHPGRTDSSGGHTNHSTGEYHYHQGESAHQHPNGVCPYDDRYSDYSSVEEGSKIQSLEEYCEENGIELSTKETDKSNENDSIIVMLLEIIGIIAVLKWLYNLFKKKS